MPIPVYIAIRQLLSRSQRAFTSVDLTAQLDHYAKQRFARRAVNYRPGRLLHALALL